jgi:predicted AlkP superfamily phosphohydrolase/phosphomutase
LRINLKGRDEQGNVDQHEYEVLRTRLIEELEALKDPETGDKVIDRVYKREELYESDYLDRAPDLVIQTRNFAFQVKGGPYPRRSYQSFLSKKDPRDFFVNGVHRLNGVFIAFGQDVQKNYCLPPLSIMDLFPTILYCLDVKIPRAIDGRLITDIFCKEYLSKFPAEYTDYDIRRESAWEGNRKTYEAERESKDIEKALKGLGYID